MAISFVGSQVGTTSATLPAHQADDVIIGFAANFDAASPSLPSGWTLISNESYCTVGYRVAASSGTSSGTWTNARVVGFLIYRDCDPLDPIGASDADSGFGSIISYPALTMERTDNSAWVVRLGGVSSTSAAATSAPTGYTLRNSRETGFSIGTGSGEIALFDSAGTVTSCEQASVSMFENNDYVGLSIELRNASTPVSQEVTGDELAASAGSVSTSTEQNISVTGAELTASGGTAEAVLGTAALVVGMGLAVSDGIVDVGIVQTTGEGIAASAGSVSVSTEQSINITGSGVTASAGTAALSTQTIMAVTGNGVTVSAGKKGVRAWREIAEVNNRWTPIV